MARHAFFGSLALFLAGLGMAMCAAAAAPSENLLPDTTKAYLSVPNVDDVRQKWDQTQLGQLLNDPAMQPFVEDLRRQLQNKLSETGIRLGLTWSDLEGTYGGEVCVATIQPGGDASQFALVLLVDVTDHVAQAQALLAKVGGNLEQKQAQRSTRQLGDVPLVVYTMPKREDESAARQAFYYIHQNWLVATNHEGTAAAILARLNRAEAAAGALANLPAFAATMQRCAKSLGEMQPHVRWFVEPFGYMETLRAAAGGRKRRGTDVLKVLANQGFTAIKGIGGCVVLAAGEQELLHHTMIYAPPVLDAGGQPLPTKYAAAAQMLEFPNAKAMSPPSWAPRDLATCFTFQWKTREAFEHAKPLVNEMVGDEVFEDVLEGIEKDPLGPQVNLRKDLVAHLGQRLTVMSNSQVPTTPQSEQLLVAIEVTDPQAVAETVNKAMESDPDAQKREYEGNVIWEILNEPEEEVNLTLGTNGLELEITGLDMGVPGLDLELPEMEIDTVGLGPLYEVQLNDSEAEAEEELERLFSNPAVTVAHQHLIFASQIDLIREVLKPRDVRDTLGESQEFQMVQESLDKIGAGEDSLRGFIRVDETLRSTYELIREGKMPESDSLLGKLLNRTLGPEEQGVRRTQQIDGSQLPEFQVARRYLGPSGLFVRSLDSGWFVSGCFLSRKAP